MQSLNKDERQILELQITQTRHPKSVADGRTEWTNYYLFSLETQVKSREHSGSVEECLTPD